MTHFTVDPAALQAQASAVAGVSDLVETAAGAAEAVGLGGDAYGVVIGPIMNPVLTALLPNSAGMIRKAAQLGDAMADGLRANSDVYQGVDDDIKQSLKSVGH